MPETGTCKQTGFLDDNYQQAGATIGDATEVWNADIVASVNAPTSEQISLMKPGPY
ncbi:NAD/NADP transhydrogenase alpha subunit [Bifidobacterium commune]|nr:NAD/NADP transhydrogenase alpha subunit [Bifidobacterium commune]